jgi:hypothetical protein
MQIEQAMQHLLDATLVIKTQACNEEIFRKNLELSPEMTIKNLKCLILHYSKNTPFFLQYNISNDKTLKDLMDILSDQDSQ